MKINLETKKSTLYGTKKGRKQPNVKRTYYFKTHVEATQKYKALKARGLKVLLRLKSLEYKTYRVQVFR